MATSGIPEEVLPSESPPSEAQIPEADFSIAQVGFMAFFRCVSICVRTPQDRIGMLLQLRRELQRQGKLKEGAYKDVFGSIKYIHNTGGIRSFWQGVGFRCGSAIAVLTFSYLSAFTIDPMIATVFYKLAGPVGGEIVSHVVVNLMTSLVSYPLEVVCTKLAMPHDRFDVEDRGGIETMKAIYRKEGVLAFYRGFSLNLIGGSAANFAYYALASRVFRAFPWLFDGILTKSLVLVGLMMLASFIAYPLETVQRRMAITAGNPSMRYKSIMDCIKTMSKEGGVIDGLYCGSSFVVVRGILVLGWGLFRMKFLDF